MKHISEFCFNGMVFHISTIYDVRESLPNKLTQGASPQQSTSIFLLHITKQSVTSPWDFTRAESRPLSNLRFAHKWMRHY